MKIYVAQNSGFCFGVKRALRKTFEAVKQKNRKIFTYGPLIHNDQVINKLKESGVNSVETIDDAKDSTLIIRSHGIPLDIYDKAKLNNIEIIDATCPFVRRVQEIAKEYYNNGYKIVIVGNPKHPEVIGINGWCDNTAYIIEEYNQINKIDTTQKMCVVAQTTITLEKWNSIVNELSKKVKELREFNTICLATKDRQEACAEIAKKVDLMIVIGGYHSSNTQKLFEISKNYCNNSIHIETADELPIELLDKCEKVGITAGASTPDWIINDVVKKIENKGGD
ncbi:4-hydroxy-3-methylbut-2-enyl diphosphate reductase [Paramaledivibacter caminithermalis]|jgi:4-hydroxy-3-methylbut-2-enyl diphosphate reductase|uniref:4-hydroxy-3-methylbut-2-enyl diphosphate reductase n=1 Tax=Paramaledivibacter caminithermalis (strain DSM 15212 / CIP 107654 / DViRD3) TaxID=1121301 RepID=A0A1M6JLV7_PARC5|nr:4-hydroxy-3-methylbut-2-enyl diphosphate reductase [Paramaledivibacter caminithermalis]SHJ47642.1 4-hydroxy-3-methylbut-2-enyl diphosphate reductase [Paramaledivibacter caminithermalis DSM 15212]